MNTANVQIGDWLGVKSPATETEILRIVEGRLAWLRKPHARLEGRAPLSLLRTDTGSRLVEELLVQIDEGMFV